MFAVHDKRGLGARSTNDKHNTQVHNIIIFYAPMTMSQCAVHEYTTT